ncbi:S49 family peptidase [Niabella ginsengisoli]|uniref:S49 family peptidase n=1 Tax=Niabella ginsengisoli TaxID=522298 RepID=UPI00293F491D|nr:S49 family peptidase [Niabella ginsengisoli]
MWRCAGYEHFFKNKLGVTFDGVKTGPLANAGNVDHPMTEQEKKLVQASIEKIYAEFKQRVAEGRKKTPLMWKLSRREECGRDLKQKKWV